MFNRLWSFIVISIDSFVSSLFLTVNLNSCISPLLSKTSFVSLSPKTGDIGLFSVSFIASFLNESSSTVSTTSNSTEFGIAVISTGPTSPMTYITLGSTMLVSLKLAITSADEIAIILVLVSFCPTLYRIVND